MSAALVPRFTGGRPRGALWTTTVRARASDLLARLIGGEPEAVRPGRAGHLIVLCHLDQPVAAGTHRWDAEQALQEQWDAETGMSPADHRQWMNTLSEVKLTLDGPAQAVRGVLQMVGICEGGIAVGPVATGALKRRGLLAPVEDAPLPWGLSADPALAGPIDLDEPLELGEAAL